jgi:hypothetical protein
MQMSINRRKFFTRLCGTLGALGTGAVLLSRRGWLGHLGPASAQAAAPPKYYTLKDNFIFFEGRKKGPDPDHLPGYLKNERAKYPIVPQIIDETVKPHQTSILNDAGGFITRLLLLDVDTGTLSQLYASRFKVEPKQAAQDIDAFIKSIPAFQEKTVTPTPGPPPASPGRERFDGIWADFSMGSANAISAIKFP